MNLESNRKKTDLECWLPDIEVNLKVICLIKSIDEGGATVWNYISKKRNAAAAGLAWMYARYMPYI